MPQKSSRWCYQSVLGIIAIVTHYYHMWYYLIDIVSVHVTKIFELILHKVGNTYPERTLRKRWSQWPSRFYELVGSSTLLASNSPYHHLCAVIFRSAIDAQNLRNEMQIRCFFVNTSRLNCFGCIDSNRTCFKVCAIEHEVVVF